MTRYFYEDGHDGGKSYALYRFENDILVEYETYGTMAVWEDSVIKRAKLKDFINFMKEYPFHELTEEDYFVHMI